MLALIGSKALHYWIPLDRPLGDLDYIGYPESVFTYTKKCEWKYLIPKHNKLIGKSPTGTMVEMELAWEGSTGAEFLKLVEQDRTVPSLDLLYALKMSHRYLKNSPHFLKTMRDIQLMRKHGAKIRDEHKEWFKRREKETYVYSHPKLNQSKKDFFNPNMGVSYVYDHDSIHRCMANLDKPAYEYFKEDKAEVKCSKDLFNALPELHKLYSVLEEVQVLALERSQIPHPKSNPKWSFDKAHEKVCTSISSGWWREYAWENYDKVQEMYDPSYVLKFWDGVRDGRVIEIKKEKVNDY